MSVLSTVQTAREGPVIEPEEQILSDAQECSRLVFTLASEAMYEHKENYDYFRVSFILRWEPYVLFNYELQDHVGYDALFQAVQGLISDPKTVEETLGFLLSLALHNFSVSGIFGGLQGTDQTTVDSRLSDIGPLLGRIILPGAIRVLWDILPQLPGNDPAVRYAIYKLFEQLVYLNHRNQVVFSSLGLVKPLLDLINKHRNDPSANDKEKHVLQKLLRRILDIGATTAESRLIFQQVVKDGDMLDTDILEIIRTGMKARWPEHFSMESPATLVLKEEGIRGMPMTGFTYMVRNNTLYLCECTKLIYLHLDLVMDRKSARKWCSYLVFF